MTGSSPDLICITPALQTMHPHFPNWCIPSLIIIFSFKEKEINVFCFVRNKGRCKIIEGLTMFSNYSLFLLVISTIQSAFWVDFFSKKSPTSAYQITILWDFVFLPYIISNSRDFEIIFFFYVHFNNIVFKI